VNNQEFTMVETTDTFLELGLNEVMLTAVDRVGYETPTPVQRKTIPLLLDGRDVIAQAQTGTGKTAAFALPILQMLDRHDQTIQALILTPTRELGIQVAEAFYTYGKHIGEISVLPVYGGQAIQNQISRLKRGVHVVVGTPGRIMDHLRRGTINFEALKIVVLDEADEMLKMGFQEDVEWILGQAPEQIQKALFSATIPDEIRSIADRYLRSPQLVEIEHTTLTVPNIDQQHIIVPEQQKVETLAHLLETEKPPGEAALVFAGTKVRTADLTEKLQARGFAAEAMHGDMTQPLRENVIRRLRNNQLEIVVATDVAARGWDVERISLVVNYDIPYDTESYVHRIGRTGRAGRAGKSILFVTPRQRRMLREIERYTGQNIAPVKMPSRSDIAERRIALFKDEILKTAIEENLDLYMRLVEELSVENGMDMAEVAAAAAYLARIGKPLEVAPEELPDVKQTRPAAGEMVRLYLDTGRKSRVRPADIVGAIANEASVPGNVIGEIDIYDRFTFVDIPSSYLKQVLGGMEGASIRGREVHIRVATRQDDEDRGKEKKVRPKERRGHPPTKKKFRRKADRKS
jgi:ATP-dependent RNA helicase DeaD